MLCSSMIMALGIARATRELGLAIPGDVSLVAHDDVFHYLKPESFPVPLTTTRSSIRAAGAAHRRAAGGAHVRAGDRRRAASCGRSTWWCAARSPARPCDLDRC